MAVDHDRHTPHEYQDHIDRAPTQSYAGRWGVVLGILALVAILGMLFIGIGNSPDGTSPQSTIERTTPTPTPAPTSTPSSPTTAPK